MEGVLKISHNNDWIFILLLIICGILILSRWAFAKYYEDLFNFENFSEKKDNFLFFNSLHLFIYTLLLGILLFPHAPSFSPEFTKYTATSQTILLCSGLFILMLLKIIINSFIFISLQHSDLLKPLLVSKSFYGMWAIMGLLLFSFLLYFSKIPTQWVSYSAVIFIAFSLFLGFSTFYKNTAKEYKFSIYYIILYLCTLEILPFMIICKTAIS